MKPRTRAPSRPGARSTRGPLPPGGAEFYSPREFAELLRIGMNQLYGAIARGEIKAARIGGQFRIPHTERERLNGTAASATE